MAWRGQNLLLSKLPMKPGQRLWLEGVIYRPEGLPFEGGGIRVNWLVAWKQAGKKPPEEREPWYGVTTLESPQQAWTYYRRRMRIEEGFRDWKQRLGLRQAAVSTAERMVRLRMGGCGRRWSWPCSGCLGCPRDFIRKGEGRGAGSGWPRNGWSKPSPLSSSGR